MAGFPNDNLNKAIIKGAIKEANKCLFGNENNIKATLVPLVILKQEVTLGENKMLSYPCLPGCVTTILLDDMDRRAVVVFLNNNIADHSEIVKALKDLDWMEILEYFSW